MRGKSWACAFSLVLTAMLVAGPVVAAPAASAAKGWVWDHTADTLVVFDPATGTITRRIVLGSYTMAYALRPDERELYVPDWENDQVAVVSTTSDAVVATIPVGDGPRGLAFSPDSRRAYVVNQSNLSVVDTGARRVVATVPVGANRNTGYAAVSPDGARVYVTIHAASGGEKLIGVVSTATNTLVRTISLGFDAGPLDQVSFAPDGRIALVSSGHVIDTATETVSHRIPAMSMSYFKFTPDGRHIHLASICARNGLGTFQLVDVTSGQVVRTIITGGNPYWFGRAAGDDRIYLLSYGDRAITVLDAVTERVLDQFGTAADPARPQLGHVVVAGGVPAPGQGQRFAPQPIGQNPCTV